MSKPTIIKKYANRRLYDTSTSRYITLEDIRQMVKDEIEFRVEDAKTGEDLTRTVLTQIIVEMESSPGAMLPVSFLRQVISFYDDKLQTVLPDYLEKTMHMFTQNQEKVREFMQTSTQDAMNPLQAWEQFGKQNFDMMEKTFSMIMSANPMMNVGKKSEKK